MWNFDLFIDRIYGMEFLSLSFHAISFFFGYVVQMTAYDTIISAFQTVWNT